MSEINPLKDVTVTVDVMRVVERRAREVPRRATGGGARMVGPISAPDDVLRVERVAKRFGEVVALREINLHLLVFLVLLRVEPRLSTRVRAEPVEHDLLERKPCRVGAVPRSWAQWRGAGRPCAIGRIRRRRR